MEGRGNSDSANIGGGEIDSNIVDIDHLQDRVAPAQLPTAVIRLGKRIPAARDIMLVEMGDRVNRAPVIGATVINDITV